MLENFLKKRILSQLPFEPNEGQEQLIDRLCLFMTQDGERPCFVATGYAGTGKSSVTGAFVRALQQIQVPFVLLAPTGRAAKVLAHYSGFPAYTIHKCVYRRESGMGDHFQLGWNTLKNALFIVDEASMISADRDNESFGSGSLLDDLIRFVFQTPDNHCRLMLIGDGAQLPPVGHTVSPALDEDYLKGYGLQISHATLTEVARQAKESGILSNATRIREILFNSPSPSHSPEGPQRTCSHGESGGTSRLLIKQSGISLSNLVAERDVCKLDGPQLVEEIERSYREVGEEETIILTRSNKRANLYNQGIRAQLLWREELLTTGDRVMVSRNNYFFTEQYQDLPFLANGDLFEVVRIRNERELYGYRFADVSLRSIDYEWEIDVVVWLDTLTTDSPDKNIALQKDLFGRVAEDYPEIKNKKKLFEEVNRSPYFNALHIRYAYAITCHKAQGGQWKRVFIDAQFPTQPINKGGTTPHTGNVVSITPQEQLRWLYTALTRATEKVFILNYNK